MGDLGSLWGTLSSRRGGRKMVNLDMRTLVLRKVTLLLRTVMVNLIMMRRQSQGKMTNCLVLP